MSYKSEFDAYLGEAIARVSKTDPNKNNIIACEERLKALFVEVARSGEYSEAGLTLNLHWQAVAAGFGQASTTLGLDVVDGADTIIHFTA